MGDLGRPLGETETVRVELSLLVRESGAGTNAE